MKTRNEILATLPHIRSVATKTWGEVFVRQVKASEFEGFWAILEGVTGAERMAKFTALALCEENGNRMLVDEDWRTLMDGPLEPLAEVTDAFLDFNGVTMTAEDEKKSSTRGSISSISSAKPSGSSTSAQRSKA